MKKSKVEKAFDTCCGLAGDRIATSGGEIHTINGRRKNFKKASLRKQARDYDKAMSTPGNTAFASIQIDRTFGIP